MSRGRPRAPVDLGPLPKLLASLAAVLVLTLAACTSPPEVKADPIFEALISDAINEALDEGATAEQIELLREAHKHGEVTLENARAANRATVRCFIESGFEAEYLDNTGGRALVVPGYSVWKSGTLSESDDMLIEECDTANVAWVNKVYQVQPASVKRIDGFVNDAADELRKCLEDSGVVTDPEATGVELAQQAGRIAGESDVSVDCLAQVEAW